MAILEPTILPARRLSGRVEAVLVASGADFVTARTSSLDLAFDGIVGDHHAGATRMAGGREPWYPRGTVMRNERQISLVCPDELAAAATRMGLPKLQAEWIGANLVIAGIAQFSMLPPRTLLFFEGGVTLKVDGQNAPCRASGKSIARHAGADDIEAMALSFKDAAKRSRGLVAWVEKPGRIDAGAKVEARLPEQWLYV
jgi:MOSC domain-containing protein YiiM